MSQDVKEPMTQKSSKLKYFPINIFAIVMGLAGFTLATYSTLSNHVLNLTLASITASVFILFTLLYVIKAIKFKDAVKEEANHPVKISFFPAFSICLLLLSSVFAEFSFAKVIWYAGCVLQLIFTLFVLNSLVNKTFNINHVNPAWFIPVAGPLIIPMAGIKFGSTFISLIAFPIGLIFWIMLFTILLYRLIFHDPLPPKLIPMLCIMLAPPSIAAVSYLHIDMHFAHGALNSPTALMFYGVAWFIFIFLLCNIKKFIKAPFFLSAWAYSFPIAAFIIATSKIVPLYTTPEYLVYVNAIIVALYALFALLILYLVIRTINLALKNKICVPE